MKIKENARFSYNGKNIHTIVKLEGAIAYTEVDDGSSYSTLISDDDFEDLDLKANLTLIEEI